MKGVDILMLQFGGNGFTVFLEREGKYTGGDIYVWT